MNLMSNFNVLLKPFFEKCFQVFFLSGLYIYRLSYLYYSLLAVLISIIVGVLVSFITYKAKLIGRTKVDKKLLFRMELYKRNKVTDEEEMKKPELTQLTEWTRF